MSAFRNILCWSVSGTAVGAIGGAWTGEIMTGAAGKCAWIFNHAKDYGCSFVMNNPASGRRLLQAMAPPAFTCSYNCTEQAALDSAYDQALHASASTVSFDVLMGVTAGLCLGAGIGLYRNRHALFSRSPVANQEAGINANLLDGVQQDAPSVPMV